MNGAADINEVNQLKYLVSCGEQIDEKASIVGQAPIHKTVLNAGQEKSKTLNAIFEMNADINVIDSNGWTALHHAANNEDVDSVN